MIDLELPIGEPFWIELRRGREHSMISSWSFTPLDLDVGDFRDCKFSDRLLDSPSLLCAERLVFAGHSPVSPQML